MVVENICSKLQRQRRKRHVAVLESLADRMPAAKLPIHEISSTTALCGLVDASGFS
jgi:hypothetical protein